MDLQTIQQAVKQISLEKGLSEESIMETINSALAAAFRKDFGQKNQNIIFEFDVKSGKMKVYDKKIVVELPEEIVKKIDENGRDKKYVQEIEEGKELPGGTEPIKFNPKNEILLEDAKKINKKIKVGEELVQELEIPADFGRMAAQTAKQVIIQKIREAERETIFNEFKSKEGQLINGVIQRREMVGILVDLGKVTALIPQVEQIRNERYMPGERMKFYIVKVDLTIKGPEIIVSRSSSELIKKLFENEIPEIASGAIDIMVISREAGFRSKVAVKSNQENIDPIGSCVGQRGARIQTIINELGGEKIDIIQWSEEPGKFIANALSPAKVLNIDIDNKTKTAIVIVNEDQLSLAIGKEGQNVRLAAKLTGWKINIMKETAEGKKEKIELSEKEAAEEAAAEKEKKEVKAKKEPKEKKATKTKKAAKKTTKKKTEKEEKTEEAVE
ncbi:MAG: transcription termination factor NusA [Candidatus Buchananbacteria bacterium RBG_13_36_9]|uniref:Transcription termination/antitermination protein NusA n=1 Tax=Candidatus Buchananbacteria bacterium RBG_13_36_9 TaxID=1797530 RepID=A0A1G1XPQ4_9BACT|nr:MAG: transcription termination factor NusA [Candidatus Buchananbacteria bacterium RBG_13_36_9]